jgi:peptide/nickel transport system substrate-binding protein
VYGLHHNAAFSGAAGALNRRPWRSRVRTAAALLVVGSVGVLASCGSDSDSDSQTTEPAAAETTGEAPGGTQTTAPSGTETTAVSGSETTEPGGTETTAPGGTETTAQEGTSAEEPKMGGILHMGASTEVAQWDPLQLGGGGSGQDRGQLIYDTLMRLDRGGNAVPQLAEGMTGSEDNTVWTMKLREGVTFTDGTPVDAEAVIWNIERMMAPDVVFINANDVEPIETVTAIDDLTIEFTLSRAVPLFPNGFSNSTGMMISPTAYETQGAVDFGQNPVGAGPFMVESWQTGAELVLVKNPNYWDSPRPYLDGVTYQIMPNALTTAQALQSGQLDVAISQDFRTLYDTMADNEDFWVNGGYNGAPGGQFVLPNSSRAPGNDIRVREAMALAFDPAVTNDAIMAGHWSPEAQERQMTCPPFLPESPYCVPGTWPEPDLDRAKELIAEYVAEGNSPQVSYLGNSSDPTHAEYVQQVLTSIGLEVEVELIPNPGYNERVFAGDYQITWFAFAPAGVPNPHVYNSLSIAGRHYGQHNDEELQAAMDQGANGATPEERVEGWQEAARILNENFYLTFMGVFPNGSILHNDVHLDYDYVAAPGYYLFLGQAWLDR